MSDMLSTGVSGLIAFQQSLSTISHNIANASTPGYSRQGANLVTNAADPTANGWIGNGVSVAGITRAYDNFLAQQTLSASSGYNQLNTVSNLAGSINNMFADSSTGLSASLQSFSQSVQAMANAPSQSTLRQAVLNQAQALVSRFKGYEASLGQLDSQVSSQLAGEAGNISSLAGNIAGLNQQILAAKAQSQQSPNDLLDQRDQLISQLSQLVGVRTLSQGDGTVSVFIGNGQPLVVGTSATALTSGPDPFNSGQQRVYLQNANGNVDITAALSGGAIGGLLQFQQQMLVPSHNALGQAAVTLANLVNIQNQSGLDQGGRPGGALLAVGAPLALANSANSGTATVTAAVTAGQSGNAADLGGLSASDYYLRYDGSSWSLVDAASGVPAALSASGSGPVTLTGAGLTLTVSGTARAGDQFLIEPFRQAVAGFSLLTSDPSRIAAAAPLVTAAAAGNTGGATIDAGSVPSMGSWVRANYTLAFTSATAYTITGSNGSSTAGTYTPGTPISFNGFTVNLSGTPASGDSFSINDNAAGSGDNRNALLLAGLMNNKVLGSGTLSLAGVVNAYVGTVGLQTSQAQNGATAQQRVLASAQAAQSSVAGVNLDEEAARMLKFEQAYQAAAQTIKVADTLFQSLLKVI
ncbi:MAG: flagellar hook-associated protein FlgK [Gammaproteobacteria bacterium]|nr:flagellar hook-associated protein FlgK [Gammaproteobacteria bacterium]